MSDEWHTSNKRVGRYSTVPEGTLYAGLQQFIGVSFVFILCSSLYVCCGLAMIPYQTAIAFGLLMTWGVYASLKTRAIGPGPERLDAIWTHAGLQTFAVAFAIGGFVAIYRNKTIHGKEHFTTTHGQVGLLTMVLTVLSPVIGGAAFARLGLLARLPEPMRPAVKWVHRKVGVAAWFASVIATLLALPHDAVKKEGGVTSAWQGAVIVSAAGVAYMLTAEPTAATGAPGRWFGATTGTITTKTVFGQKR